MVTFELEELDVELNGIWYIVNITCDGGIEDASFDHAFGIEEVFIPYYENLTITSIEYEDLLGKSHKLTYNLSGYDQDELCEQLVPIIQEIHNKQIYDELDKALKSWEENYDDGPPDLD